jgi:hypothetical protein
MSSKSISPKFATIIAGLIFVSPIARAEDAKFVADNLKYSRDFYSKVHFVAIAELPHAFKYDRYPATGPERIQCAEGTYLRQHGKPWAHLNEKMRVGLPIDYPERNAYFMTFALREEWGSTGEPVDNETASKLDGWIRLVDAAINLTPANAKLLDKSETPDGRAQWVFEAPSGNPDGVASRFTFRKPTSDKKENVLLHEFSGSMRVEADKVVPSGAVDVVRFGFGYMMRVQDGNEVSEYVWEKMQEASEQKAKGSPKPTTTRQPKKHGKE